jgi:hypothetical protein
MRTENMTNQMLLENGRQVPKALYDEIKTRIEENISSVTAFAASSLA